MLCKPAPLRGSLLCGHAIPAKRRRIFGLGSWFVKPMQPLARLYLHRNFEARRSGDTVRSSGLEMTPNLICSRILPNEIALQKRNSSSQPLTDDTAIWLQSVVKFLLMRCGDGAARGGGEVDGRSPRGARVLRSFSFACAVLLAAAYRSRRWRRERFRASRRRRQSDRHTRPRSRWRHLYLQHPRHQQQRDQQRGGRAAHRYSACEFHVRQRGAHGWQLRGAERRRFYLHARHHRAAGRSADCTASALERARCFQQSSRYHGDDAGS